MDIYPFLDRFGFVELSAIGSMEQLENVQLVVRGATVQLRAYVVQPHGQAAIYFRCRQNRAHAIYIETGQATLVIPARGPLLFAFGEHPGIRDTLRAEGFERHVDDYDR